MPDNVSINSESFSIPATPSFISNTESEAAKSSDRFRQEFFTDMAKPNLLVQQSLEDFFKSITDGLHQKIVDSQKGKSTVGRAKAELQPNGCYSSPVYESIIDKAAQEIYDPRDLGDISNMRHMYDCRINNDVDAVKYAAQALKFDNDPYTAVVLDVGSFPDYFGKIGITMKTPAEEGAVKPGAKPGAKSAQEWLTVESVEAAGPAARAGMLPGDQVRVVDGVSMAGKSVAEVANILRGPANTVVEVSVMRQGTLKKLEIRRVEIEMPASPKSAADAHQAGIGASVGLLAKDLNHVSIDGSKKIAGNSDSLVAQENDLVLTSIVPGSPAERAGLKRGDIVCKVDGQPVSGLTIEGATSRIRGASGRAVELRILRNGKFVDLSIVRAPLRVEDVVTDKALGDGIAYIKFTDFMHPDGTKRLMEAMQRQAGAKSIVLDLRDNGGGMLNQALKNISMFLWKGDAMTMDRRKPSSPDALKYETTKYSVTGDAYITTTDDGSQKPLVETSKREVPYLLNGRPLVILTNGNSASASELFAGALHDNGVAKLVGEKTYGKGIGQNYEDRGSYTQSTTTFRYYTPKGFWPGDAHNNRIGIGPDIPVQDSLMQGDPQLDAAIKYLKEIQSSKKVA